MAQSLTSKMTMSAVQSFVYARGAWYSYVGRLS